MEELVFGIDVGGTSVKLGIFNKKLELLTSASILTSDNLFECIFAQIKKMCEDRGALIKDIKSIGIALPGPVDSSGIVHGLTNLGYETFDGKKLFNEKFAGIPTFALNDANAAALGEYTLLPKKIKDVVFVTLGTGVGGGIISNGHLLTGDIGGAGEIGHITVNYNETKPCSCGKCGCLEQYASATGIVNIAKEKYGFPDNISAKEIFDWAKGGNVAAIRVVHDFSVYLAKGLGIVASVLNPKAIIIGGGVSNAGDILIESVTTHFEKYVFAPSKNVEFRLAKLGDMAGVYGAALYAKQLNT